MDRPIVALATPPLKGALAIIRTSGDGVFAILSTLFSKNLVGCKREIFLGTIKTADGDPIDQVVILTYPGPNSMTGEDVAEIICHGSMLIVGQIVEALEGKGFAYASRGEFSSRAFYHGKMDLIEAEAVNDVINATTVEAKNLALMSLSGKASRLVKPIRDELADLVSLIEVGIDYPEYTDIEQASAEKIYVGCQKIEKEIDALIQGGRQGKIVREGVKVALVGEPNVGKSSLLNALLDEQKAIVSSIPGTTRDVVEGELNVKGVALHLLDTAGIRESKGEIERQGVQRSIKAIQEADLILFIVDAREKKLSPKEEEILESAKGKNVILCHNKADLVTKKEPGELYASAKLGQIEELKEAIYRSLSLTDDAFQKPSLANDRQLGILEEMRGDLKKAEEDAKADAPMDLISVNLTAAYNAARRLLGEGETTDLSDEIFSRFCVGK